jgi:hypothetical protein
MTLEEQQEGFLRGQRRRSGAVLARYGGAGVRAGRHVFGDTVPGADFVVVAGGLGLDLPALPFVSNSPVNGKTG